MKKLATHGYDGIQCSERDLEALFRVTEEEEVNMLPALITAVHYPPPIMNGTEGSFIQFWDDNIRRLLQHIFPSGRAVRDTNKGTSTGLSRPDFGFLVNGVCVFRGEEKQNSYDGTHPRDELWQELDWTYDPAPYILGQCLRSLINGCMTEDS